MTRTLKRTLLASSLALAALCSPLAMTQAQAAGTLTVALHQDPGNWDPIATFPLLG